MDKRVRKLIGSILVLLLALTACAEVRLHPLPAPPPTGKLRVYVKAFTIREGEDLSGDKSNLAYQKSISRMTDRNLRGKGIYEVVSEEQFQLVFEGGMEFTRWAWVKKDWALARQVGNALHADYAFIVERIANKGILFRELTLMNVETGRQFKTLIRVPALYRDDLAAMLDAAYRRIFQEAKGDMLTTVINKGRRSAPESFGPKAAAPVEKPGAIEKAPAPAKPETAVDLEQLLKAEIPAAGGTRLAVYDLSASEPFRMVALILSEALREELFRLGNFILVNRENISQVVNEMGLQQTGLVDEKQAVQVGKGLAVRQIVLGQFGSLGKTSILQAKRIDVETQNTLALGSIRCTQGKEEELLAGLPELAKKLAGK